VTRALNDSTRSMGLHAETAMGVRSDNRRTARFRQDTAPSPLLHTNHAQVLFILHRNYFEGKSCLPGFVPSEVILVWWCNGRSAWAARPVRPNHNTTRDITCKHGTETLRADAQHRRKAKTHGTKTLRRRRTTQMQGKDTRHRCARHRHTAQTHESSGRTLCLAVFVWSTKRVRFGTRTAPQLF
jgi:hypothetical protein